MFGLHRIECGKRFVTRAVKRVFDLECESVDRFVLLRDFDFYFSTTGNFNFIAELTDDRTYFFEVPGRQVRCVNALIE